MNNQKSRSTITVERALRGIAGSFIVLSVALGYFVHPAFFAFTAFVGLNLLQSAFSNWCPMVWILQKAGLQSCSAAATPVHHG